MKSVICYAYLAANVDYISLKSVLSQFSFNVLFVSFYLRSFYLPLLILKHLKEIHAQYLPRAKEHILKKTL